MMNSVSIQKRRNNRQGSSADGQDRTRGAAQIIYSCTCRRTYCMDQEEGRRVPGMNHALPELVTSLVPWCQAASGAPQWEDGLLRLSGGLSRVWGGRAN